MSFYKSTLSALELSQILILEVLYMAKKREIKREILIQCGFTPEQVDTLAEHDLIDKAIESAYGPVPYEVKELLGLRGC